MFIKVFLDDVKRFYQVINTLFHVWQVSTMLFSKFYGLRRVREMSLKRLFYTLFLYLIFPLVLLRLLWRSFSNPDYRFRLSERLGFVKTLSDDSSILWLHAVSVGEVIAAKPLVLSLLDTFPQHKLLVTTTTPTGSDRVNAIFKDQIQQHRILHTYFPYDLLGSVARFINSFKPEILIVVETEIWPNLYAKCNKQNIPIILVNARLSDKSMHSYQKIRSLLAETLSNVSLIAVRSESDEQRFLKLGAIQEKIKRIGNIKYDLQVDDFQIKKAKNYTSLIQPNNKKPRLVFVAASTHQGEDAKILSVYKSLIKQFPSLLLILVPRHPERFDDVYDECLQHFESHLKVVRHSHYKQQNHEDTQVILGDSMGEMQMWYSLAHIVFIGGSLVETGGHNPLEATIFGVPVLSGPHMFNFEDIALELTEQNLLTICDNETVLIAESTRLLDSFYMQENNENNHKGNYSDFKEIATGFMQKHQGVTARLVNLIKQIQAQ